MKIIQSKSVSQFKYNFKYSQDNRKLSTNTLEKHIYKQSLAFTQILYN